MAKDILVVSCNRDIRYDDWDSIVNYIQSQVGTEYYVIGALKGIEIKCLTDEDKVFNIDGDYYSYSTLKELIENSKNNKIEEKKEDKLEENTIEEVVSEDDSSEKQKKETKKND